MWHVSLTRPGYLGLDRVILCSTAHEFAACGFEVDTRPRKELLVPYTKLSFVQGPHVVTIEWPSVAAASAQLRRPMLVRRCREERDVAARRDAERLLAVAHRCAA